MTDMPRFAILLHKTSPDYERPTHWDLLLERGDALDAWALAEEPAIGKTIAAERLPDHRLRYLDYEGPISGGRGSVSKWDTGTFVITSDQADRLVIRVSGGQPLGEVVIEQQSDSNCCRVSFHADS